MLVTQILKDTFDHIRIENIICKTIVEEKIGSQVLKNFDHAHSSLKNVIERRFGVPNACFLILKRIAPSLHSQILITVICITLHTFLKQETQND